MRRRELAVRVARGASRRSLFRHVLADGLLLGAGGTAVGLLLAFWLIEAAPSLAAILEWFAPRFDLRMLVYAASAMAFSVGFTVLAPWLDAIRHDPLAAIRGDHAPRQVRWRRMLVDVQIALCVSLSYAGVLMSRSLSPVMSVRPGMDIDRPLLLAEVFLKRPDAAFEQLANDFAALPGVVDVAYARRVHFAAWGAARASSGFV